MRGSPRIQHGSVLEYHEPNTEVPKQIQRSSGPTRANSIRSRHPTRRWRVYFHTVD